MTHQWTRKINKINIDRSHQTSIGLHKQTNGHTTNGHTDKRTYKQTDRQPYRQTNGHIDKQTDKRTQTNGYTDKRDTQTNGQTAIQTER